MLNAARLVRVITMALGNITCIIAAACVTYLPSEQKWNRLVAYWFTQFQVRPTSSLTNWSTCRDIDLPSLLVSPCHL